MTLGDRGRYYILKGHTPVPATLEVWGSWFGGTDRRVEFTDLGFCSVSTVFLGLDHRLVGEGPPLLFETMTFAAPVKGETFPEELDGMTNRYTTWDEAEAGHAQMVAEVREKFWQKRANGK